MSSLKKCPCCGNELLPINTQVQIIDNFDDHEGYIEGSVELIVDHDDCGNYILSSGYCVSEAEIEIINKN